MKNVFSKGEKRAPVAKPAREPVVPPPPPESKTERLLRELRALFEARRAAAAMQYDLATRGGNPDAGVAKIAIIDSEIAAKRFELEEERRAV